MGGGKKERAVGRSIGIRREVHMEVGRNVKKRLNPKELKLLNESSVTLCNGFITIITLFKNCMYMRFVRRSNRSKGKETEKNTGDRIKGGRRKRG